MAKVHSFEDLPTLGAALVDFGSVFSFFEKGNCEFMRGEVELLKRAWRIRERQSEKIRTSTLRSQLVREIKRKYPEALRFFEQLVVNEVLVMDEAILDHELRIQPTDPRFREIVESPFIATCQIPKEVLHRTADEISAYDPLISQWNTGMRMYGNDKAAHDSLFELVPNGSCPDSGDNSHRAYFYVHVAAQAQVPLVISEGKQKILRSLKRRYDKSIHQQLSELAINKTNFFPEITAPLPPVQEVLLRRVIDSGLTPWQVFVELRDSKPAVDYRFLLREINARGFDLAPERMLAAEEVKELQGMVERFAEYGGKDLRRPTRLLSIQEFPVIGWVTKVAGIFKEVKVRDIRFSAPRPAHVFIADWFRKSKQ